MAQAATNDPETIRVAQVGGLNERVSPSNLRPGEFLHLEGLYPSQVGLLSRIPGKEPLAIVPGNTNILQITQTFNINGDILIHTDSGRFAYTLDELLGRATGYNLTPGTTPSGNVEEEGMSQAIMLQMEGISVGGGSAQGYLAPTDSSSAANTFYGRRLTSNPVNESSTLVSFAASTGGTGGAGSTPGQFVLSPATYRITAWFTFFGLAANGISATVALYNNTTSSYQLNTDGVTPIIGTAAFGPTTSSGQNNFLVNLKGRFTVTGSNSTFQINHAAGTQNQARSIVFGGTPSAVTTTIGGFSPNSTFGLVEILKEP